MFIRGQGSGVTGESEGARVKGARVKGTRRRGKGQGEALLVNFKKLTSFFTKDSLNVLIASVCDCKLSSCRIMQDSTIVYNI